MQEIEIEISYVYLFWELCVRSERRLITIEIGHYSRYKTCKPEKRRGIIANNRSADFIILSIIGIKFSVYSYPAYNVTTQN